jgi:hypothetical protein
VGLFHFTYNIIDITQEFGNSGLDLDDSGIILAKSFLKGVRQSLLFA